MKVINKGQEKNIKVNKNKTLLECMRMNGISIDAVCGGGGTCGKCKVLIRSGCPEANEEERIHLTKKEIESGVRLACMHAVDENMVVEVLESNKFKIVSSFEGGHKISIKEELIEKYGVAIDIGTTTVAIALVDLGNGDIKDVATFINPQKPYGADVISRISYTTKENPVRLHELIVEGLKEGILGLQKKNNIRGKDILKISIVGNTTMMYLLMNKDPSPLAVAPFRADFIDLYKTNGMELLGIEELKNCEVTLLPGISAYVGADVVAGMLLLGIDNIDKTTLFIDIGTNGEMAATKNGQIYCASTAAGPALEGATIKDGTGCVDGAISSVIIREDDIEYETINNYEPIGICGSAVVDIISEGLKAGLINEMGRLENDILIAETSDKKISFCQQDVREVQLAKSAIYSGVMVLLDHLKVDKKDIEKLYLSGGFGTHLNIKNSEEIGLIPMGLEEKVKIVGNSALGGAIQYLFDEHSEEKIMEIKKKSKYIELSTSEEFKNYFVENMTF